MISSRVVLGFAAALLGSISPKGSAAISINPDSRLAAWSKTVECDKGKYYLFEPHVYFQHTQGDLGEALYNYAKTCPGPGKPGNWSQGQFFVPKTQVRANTPLATIRYADRGDVVFVYYVDVNDGLVVREFTNQKWGGAIQLNQKVSKSATQIAAFRKWTGVVTLWFESDDKKLVQCSYMPSSSNPPCQTVSTDYTMSDGSGIAATDDWNDNYILWMQNDVLGEDNMDSYWQDRNNAIYQQPQGAQVAAAFGSVPANGANSWVFIFNQNRGLNAYQYDQGAPGGYSGPMTVQNTSPIPSVKNGLAATSARDAGIRVWYVTASNHIAEAFYGEGKGWIQDNDDILHDF